MRRLRREHRFPLTQAAVLGRLDRDGPHSIGELAAIKLDDPAQRQTVLDTLLKLAASNDWPPFATITGSTTTGTPAAFSRRTSHTQSIVAASPSIPVLTTSAPISSSTQAICIRTRSSGTAWIAWTARVSCAVNAVIAVAA